MTWLTGWKKRIKLDIDYTNKIGASVTHFPVAIFLKSDNGDSTKVFDEVGANSRKIAITKADGETELKGEIEQWDSVNEKGVIHTSITGWTINANTSIYLYYDNDHANNGNIGLSADGSVATHAVWDSNFKMVQHMVDDTTSAIKDSTSNNNDGAKLGAGEPAEADGKIGKGQDFDGTDDRINVGTDSSLDVGSGGDFTIEAWIKTLDVSEKGTIFRGDSIGTDPQRKLYSMTIRTDGKIYLEIIDSDNSMISPATTSATVDDGSWHHVVGVLDSGATAKIYLDGAEDASEDASEITGAINPSVDKTIGSWINQVPEWIAFFDGIIDEIRFSNSNRSAAWIKATYNSGNDSLLTYGDELIQGENATFFGSNF